MRPKVSVLTSWFDCPIEKFDRSDVLPISIRTALSEGIEHLDLYFVSHSEIDWFAAVAGVDNPSKNPTVFAGDLRKSQLDAIADRLISLLFNSPTNHGVVTWHPEFTGLATFFPAISEFDDSSNRSNAIQAVRNAIYLASRLGAPIVEIVGGAGVPNTESDNIDPTDKYTKRKLESFADAIEEVYRGQDAEKWFGSGKLNLPRLAIELEPGASFLMNGLDRYREFYQIIQEKGDDDLCNLVTLNLDVAHAFMLGYDRSDIKEPIRVGHMHLSDHGAHYKSGGSHSSDVVPGKFHSTVEYEPWIELAVHLCREEYFSKTIGIELEACNQLERVHAAKSIIERLIDAAVPTEGDQSSPEKEGCILTLDIGNSTKGILFEGGNEGAVSRLQNLIESGVELVFRNQGEIVSFGGDGFIALFEKKRFDRENRVAENTFNAIRCLRDWWIEIRKEKAPGLQLRIGVHFGNVSILSTNRLRGQALSLDLVTSVRLCDNCKEEAKSDHNKFFCLLSEEVKELFEKAQGLLAEEKRQLQAEIASREEETAERLLERENRLLRDELELLVGLNFVHFPPVEINGKERTRYWIVWPNSSTLNPGE